MTTKRLAPLGGGIVAVALGAALILSAPTAAVAAPQTEGLQYVALGDSYAAGFGITPSTGAPVAGCEQADQNYPHQVAAALGMALTDVTCTGAVTANIIGTSQETPTYFNGGGTANPQSQSLSADTDVLTVSIGGNDAGFSSIAEACLALSATGPVLGTEPKTAPFQEPTCETAFANATPVIDLAANVTGFVAADLANAYAAIRDAAPNAEVFVVGYPSIFPAGVQTDCFVDAFPNGILSPPYATDAVPFTDSDVTFIHGIEVLLNQVIAEQAAAAGFIFIDNQPGSLDHSVCPQQAQGGDPYINGVTVLPIDFADPEPPYTANGALHPNATGVAFLASQVTPVIAAAFPAPSPTPTAAPLPTSAPVLAESGGVSWSPTSLGLGAALLLSGAAALVALRARARRG